MNEPDDEQPFGVSCDVVFADMGTGQRFTDVRAIDHRLTRCRLAGHDGPVADSRATEPPNQQAGRSGYQRAEQLLALTEEDPASLDPAEVNLLVAKGIPSLANLDIPHYQAVLDSWAAEVQARIPLGEITFWQSPQDWKNDVNFFRLGLLCEYLDTEQGVRYKESHVNLQSVRYTNPSDLFINGVIDTREGTCGNLAVLHVAIGRRLGWPVHLACAGSHLICRYDDGQVVHNIETTRTGEGGFVSWTDGEYVERYGIRPIAVKTGSDLTTLTAGQTLGMFIGLRARHFMDTDRIRLADQDYSLARSLFPESQRLWLCGTETAMIRKNRLFDAYAPVLVFDHDPNASFGTGNQHGKLKTGEAI